MLAFWSFSRISKSEDLEIMLEAVSFWRAPVLDSLRMRELPLSRM